MFVIKVADKVIAITFRVFSHNALSNYTRCLCTEKSACFISENTDEPLQCCNHLSISIPGAGQYVSSVINVLNLHV